VTIEDAADYADELYRYVQPLLEATEEASATLQAVYEEQRPYLDFIAQAHETVRQMADDMGLAGILARQTEAFVAMGIFRRAPTEAELNDASARLTEAVPETEEAREEIALEVAGIAAEAEGRRLLDLVRDQYHQILVRLPVESMKDGAALLFLAWLVFYVLPTGELGPIALWYALASDWTKRNRPKE
jgi:hypothetical protein